MNDSNGETSIAFGYTPEERAALEQRAQSILKACPDVESFIRRGLSPDPDPEAFVYLRTTLDPSPVVTRAGVPTRANHNGVTFCYGK